MSDTATYCYRCGALLGEQARFCKSCGAPRAQDPTARQPADPTAHHTAAHHPPPPGYESPPGITPLSQAPVPAPVADRQRPLLIVACALTALVLVTGAVLAIVLSGGEGAHTQSAPAVTAASASRLPATPSVETKTSASLSTPAGGAAREEPVPLRTATYHGARFTAQVPSEWSILEDEAAKEGYLESKWRNPADSSDSLLVDISPTKHLPPEKQGAPVHEALLRADGYQELAYRPGDLAGADSWMWVFRISGDERVDYFFEKCTTGFAVLGSSTPARFARLQATFHAVAQSVQSTCSGG